MAVTEEIYPGFRCPTLAHTGGPLRVEIIRDMRLERHGLRMIRPEVRVAALSPEGAAVLFFDDVRLTANGLAAVSPRDAQAYAEFTQVLGRIGEIFHQLAGSTPPAIDQPSPDDLLEALKGGRMIRKLGRRDMYRFLRWGPMAIADLLDEWFETPLLKAALAARAILGCIGGPRSPGTANLLLLRCGDDPNPAGPTAFPEGGLGALTQALASSASAAGATIRTSAEVTGVLTKDGCATGVRLANGEEIPAQAVLSNADPVRTLLKLVDPVHLTPALLQHLQHYRSCGVLAKVNLVLDGLPSFNALQREGGEQVLTGRIHIGPSMDYLERAFDASKYGEFSSEPYLEVVIPSLTDPSLAPAGKHVLSIYAQFAPYNLRKGDWRTRNQQFADAVINVLSGYAPDLPAKVLHCQVITPADIESTFGVTGGHPYHGELALEQFFTMRPLLGWARYRTPVKGLYMCGAGTHPGSGLNGASGANAAREMIKDLR
jgi:phytoene dehydrogenase-like protein